MFLKIDNIVIGNLFIGLEVFTANGEDGISLVTVEKRKNELVITHKEKRSQFEKLQEIPNKDNCIFLIINNSQIIQKEVEGTDSNDGKTLNKAFPNLKQEDFYYEICRVETKSIVAICRKNYVEELVADFKIKGIDFSGISLGVCSVSNSLSFIEYENLNTNSQTLALANEDTIIKPFDGNTKIYEINGLEVDNYYLLGFSVVLGLIIKNNLNSGNIIQLNKHLWDNYYQKKFFAKGIKIIVYSLLMILLINFFVFNHYFNAVNHTTSDLEANKNLINSIKAVRSSLKNKEERFNTTYNGNNSKSSFIINQIINELPTSILLDQMVYHPLEKNIKEGEAIINQNNIILITGKTINNSALTNWIESIQKHKDIANVTITQFGKNEVKETVFMLKIKTDEAE